MTTIFGLFFSILGYYFGGFFVGAGILLFCIFISEDGNKASSATSKHATRNTAKDFGFSTTTGNMQLVPGYDIHGNVSI